ncbi:MAG: aminoglycoside phosphotransferase family protein [Chloroflexi bacterium]|nr:aminoglycoside phosphotransferase family protein [Chloroflexota bacterium]
MTKTLQDDADPLQKCLDRVVRSEFGKGLSITGIERSRSPLSSWYACDVITVHLSTGQHFQVWLKNFGTYRLVKDHMMERRERELCVYRDLLADANLGIARYYGSVWDDSKGTFWLLLEHVNGEILQYHEYPYWVASASWLGRMQRYMGQHSDRLSDCPVLAEHDRHFFVSTAERALHSVSQLFPSLARNLEEVLGKYDNLVETLVRQPKTLVHGDYTPRQIIVDAGSSPARICPVDWEGAAMGSSLFDLAILADGFDGNRLDEILLAYGRELGNCDVQTFDLDDIKHFANCVRLHRVMGWLSRSFEHRYPESTVTKLLRMAKELANVVS